MRRTKIEKSILFLCEDNACLSLMAESMASYRRLPKIRVFSAGIRPGQIPRRCAGYCRKSASNFQAARPRAWIRFPPTISIWWFPSETRMNSAVPCPAKPRWKSGRFQTRCGLRAKVPLFSRLSSRPRRNRQKSCSPVPGPLAPFGVGVYRALRKRLYFNESLFDAPWNRRRRGSTRDRV